MDGQIYSGPRSCYARREGVYVAAGPMDLAKAAAHLYLHLRDMERGWTYGRGCEEVEMTEELFEARSRYLIEICEKQGGRDCGEVEELVVEVLRSLALPKWAEDLAASRIVRLARLF